MIIRVYCVNIYDKHHLCIETELWVGICRKTCPARDRCRFRSLVSRQHSASSHETPASSSSSLPSFVTIVPVELQIELPAEQLIIAVWDTRELVELPPAPLELAHECPLLLCGALVIVAFACGMRKVWRWVGDGWRVCGRAWRVGRCRTWAVGTVVACCWDCEGGVFLCL